MLLLLKCAVSDASITRVGVGVVRTSASCFLTEITEMVIRLPIYKLSGKPSWFMKKEKIQFNKAHNSTSKDPHKSAISSEEIKWGQWQGTLSYAFPVTFI